MKMSKTKKDEALSRRGFLRTAVVGGAAIAASGPVVGAVEPKNTETTLQDPLEELVERFGSELGDVRKVQSTSSF